MKMTQKKGIDISTWQGSINWSEVAKRIDFAIIRTGFGANNLDNRALDNIQGCVKNKVPFGLYWFSYALNADMAKKEADYVCDIADKFKPVYPIAYDWEDDSEDYAKKNGVKMTDSLREKFAVAFLEQVKKRGYTPMLYCNYSDINGAYKNIYKKYSVWYASPGSNTPKITADIWQNSWSGRIAGISGDVDTNICYTEYAKKEAEYPEALINKLVRDFGASYMSLADEVILGKYETGTKRRKMIEDLGYDYDIVQAIVNYKLLGR